MSPGTTNQPGRMFQAFRRQLSTAPQRKPGYFGKILAGTGLAAYSYYQYEHYSRNIELARRLDIPFYKVLLYKAIPFSAMSGIAQWIEKQEINSKMLRKSLFGAYARVFGCNMSEATKPLEEFSSFGEFFARPLKPGSRNFEEVDGLVSSTDGKVLHCGQVHFDDSGSAFPEQVKGSLYKLSDLIGTEAAMRFSNNSGRSVYYCTVYLAPGDYHRFHAPTKLEVESVASFSGEVLSVSPIMMKLVPNLLCMNERKAVNGTWRHGRISFVSVGAANVGSVVLNESVQPSAKLRTGDEIGRFELGSTVVYIFEAPSSFTWKVQPGDKIKLGQALFAKSKPDNKWFGWF